MGSSGFGRFGNYPVGGSGAGSGGIGGQSGSGGFGGEDSCPADIDQIFLEDVATSEYYVKRGVLPGFGERVELLDHLYLRRLVVASAATGEIIGNLPTEFNKLLFCIKRGMHYSGTVLSSGTTPVPYVTVNLHV